MASAAGVWARARATAPRTAAAASSVTSTDTAPRPVVQPTRTASGRTSHAAWTRTARGRWVRGSSGAYARELARRATRCPRGAVTSGARCPTQPVTTQPSGLGPARPTRTPRPTPIRASMRAARPRLPPQGPRRRRLSRRPRPLHRLRRRGAQRAGRHDALPDATGDPLAQRRALRRHRGAPPRAALTRPEARAFTREARACPGALRACRACR